MKKTIALVAAGVIGLAVLAKTTNVSSYVSTLWSQARVAAKASVPTKFEIDRIRNDIASLDQDLDRMLRPIADHKVNVDNLRKDVTRDAEKLAEQKKVLLDATAAVRGAGKGDKLVYAGKAFTVEQVKTRIALDFESYKRFEATVAAQKKVLESKEATLLAAQEQLSTFISRKKEFEVQLAQLEAENEVNQVAAVGTDIKIDTTRVTTIAQSLGELRQTIEKDRLVLEMRNGILNANNIQLSQPQQSVAVDLEAIQTHLEGGGTSNAKTTSTVSNNK